MTAEEFTTWLRQQDSPSALLELDRGRVVERALPRGPRHGIVCANVVGLLRSLASQRSRGFVCGNVTGVVLERNPDTVLAPAVALFGERCSFAALRDGFIDERPVLIVETVARSGELDGERIRAGRFLEGGVPEVWLIDLEARTTTVCRSGREPTICEEAEVLTLENLLIGWRCQVSQFFDMPGAFEEEMAVNQAAYAGQREQIRHEHAGQIIVFARGQVLAVAPTFAAAQAALEALRPFPASFAVFRAEEDAVFEPLA
jgi:Uma2 family endonuclease